jgi:cytochrome c peroxidase
MRARFCFLAPFCGFLCTLMIVCAGCSPAADKKAPATKKEAVDAKAAAAAMPPEDEAAAAKPVQKAGESAGKAVLLGSPELTDGIPGDGELTVEHIKAWIDDPQNLAVLEVELPLGLSTGLPQAEAVLEANPLTLALIELGRQLYFDKRLSVDGTVSCASCHDPDQGFGANTQFGVGVRGQKGGRNSPISYNRIFSGPQFWDGRAASLEEQAKGPIANPIEMAHTHEEAVAAIKANEGYRLEFDRVFGGKDGDNVNIDNIAKAIASFERVLVTGPSPFDYYEQLKAYAGADMDDLKEDPELFAQYEKVKANAEAHPMSESAIRGREIFFSDKGSCTACHVGPNFTDELYHNLGVGMDAEKPDLGRYEVTKEEKDKGAFKTPTIRNVEFSAPYMHDGSQKTLEEVVAWYAKGGHPNPTLDPKVKKLDLTDQEKADLIAFMKACTGEFPKIERGRLPK